MMLYEYLHQIRISILRREKKASKAATNNIQCRYDDEKS
jgi:hypothetical protein